MFDLIYINSLSGKHAIIGHWPNPVQRNPSKNLSIFWKLCSEDKFKETAQIQFKSAGTKK